MSDLLEYLNLTQWPFDVVPPNGPSRIWYGRPELRQQLEQIVRAWTIRKNSTIYLLWVTSVQERRTHSDSCSRCATNSPHRR